MICDLFIIDTRQGGLGNKDFMHFWQSRGRRVSLDEASFDKNGAIILVYMFWSSDWLQIDSFVSVIVSRCFCCKDLGLATIVFLEAYLEKGLRRRLSLCMYQARPLEGSICTIYCTCICLEDFELEDTKEWDLTFENLAWILDGFVLRFPHVEDVEHEWCIEFINSWPGTVSLKFFPRARTRTPYF